MPLATQHWRILQRDPFSTTVPSESRLPVLGGSGLALRMAETTTIGPAASAL